MKTGQCKICGSYGPIGADGRIPQHTSLKSGVVCRGAYPASGRPEEYPVGYDSDPWVMGGGLPERNRSRF